MDVSEVDQDAEDEDEEDYEEQQGTENRYANQASSTLTRQSSYHHIPSQAYQHQVQKNNTNQRQGNYHLQQQNRTQGQHQNLYGSQVQQPQRRFPSQPPVNRQTNSNSGGYHQPRPPPRHPPYPAHAVVSTN